MGVFDFLPEGVRNIDFAGILQTIGKVFGIVILFIFAACIVGFIYYRKKNALLYKEKLHFFEEVRGQAVPVDDLVAAELIVPNTDVRVFYCKAKDLYLPRATRKMGKNAYWYMIRDNKEIVNFTMKNMNKEMKKANLDYDHTDMRYAHINLKEIIQRNYKDKSKKWWLEYKDVISMVIWISVMSLSFFFLLSQINKLIGAIAPLLDHADQIIESIANLQQVSGIKPA